MVMKAFILLVYKLITIICFFFAVGTGGQNETGSACQDRTSLNTCLQQLPPILEQSELKGIPSSKKDVDASCR